MLTRLRRLFGVACLVACTGMVGAASGADGAVLIELWPSSPAVRQAHRQIEQSGLAERLVALIDQRMALQRAPTIVLGGKGSPRVSTEAQLIVMPYEHLLAIESDLAAASDDGLAAANVVMDAFAYSLVHQLSRVAIAQQEHEGGQWLGEDAVADLTLLTLLEHVPDGDRIARHALELFDKQIGSARSSDNFWRANGLNAERYWSAVCQLLGAGVALGDVRPPGDTGDSECGERYAALRNSWSPLFVDGSNR